MSQGPPTDPPNGSPFSNEPPDGHRKKPFVEIVRPNAKNRWTVKGWCVSPHPVGVSVHWAGRNVVCTKNAGWCQLCENKIGSRWYGYLGVVANRSTKLFLIEITPSVYATVEQQLADNMTLRGTYLTLTRPSEKVNGRLAIEFGSTVPGDPAGFPAVPDLEAIVKRIYQLGDDEQEGVGDDPQ